MILTEYDEKKHFRTLFREGKEEGIKEGMALGLQQGREAHLRELVQKKLSRGKTLSEIAEDLEEDIAVIEQIALQVRSK